MNNASTLIALSLQALLQVQQYQTILARAAAEGRDVSDDEVAKAKASAKAAIDALEQAA